MAEQHCTLKSLKTTMKFPFDMKQEHTSSRSAGGARIASTRCDEPNMTSGLSVTKEIVFSGPFLKCNVLCLSALSASWNAQARWVQIHYNSMGVTVQDGREGKVIAGQILLAKRKAFQVEMPADKIDPLPLTPATDKVVIKDNKLILPLEIVKAWQFSPLFGKEFMTRMDKFNAKGDQFVVSEQTHLGDWILADITEAVTEKAIHIVVSLTMQEHSMGATMQDGREGKALHCFQGVGYADVFEILPQVYDFEEWLDKPLNVHIQGLTSTSDEPNAAQVWPLILRSLLSKASIADDLEMEGGPEEWKDLSHDPDDTILLLKDTMHKNVFGTEHTCMSLVSMQLE